MADGEISPFNILKSTLRVSLYTIKLNKNLELNEHGWITQVGLFFVVSGSGFDSNSSREFVRIKKSRIK